MPRGRQPIPGNACGTPRGYRRHIRGKQKACDDCRDAMSVQRQVYMTPATRRQVLARAKARRHALVALSREYPERYAALLELHLRKAPKRKKG